MVIFPFTLYQHVVYVHFNILPNLLDEHFVHGPLIRRFCILQPKRHDLVAKKPLACDKQSILLIEFVQPDLIIARENVHEA